MKRNSFFIGLLASLSLVIFYFVVMLLFTGSPSIAISQIRNLWPWFTILVVGFGIQFGLYHYLRHLIMADSTSNIVTAANTGISSVSMVACCAHHLTDVLPLFGLAWLSVFLARYQVWFIGIGIVSNFLGIIYLLRQINKHKAYVQK